MLNEKFHDVEITFLSGRKQGIAMGLTSIHFGTY